MRALKIAGAAIAAVIVVVALLLIIGIPSGFLTSAIQERVERDTGYRLTIAGATKIGLWPSLNVTLNDVTLQDPKDRDSQQPPDRRQRPGRHHAGERVVGPPAHHRARDQPPGASMCRCCASARATLNPSAKPAASAGEADADAPTIDRVTRHRRHGGVFQSARPRRKSHRGHQRRCRDRRRPQDQDHRQRARQRASAQIRDQGDRAGAADGAAEHSGRTHASTPPACLQAPLSAKAEVRLNGSVVMINGVTGTLGDGAFNGWASVDLVEQAAGETRSRLPAARYRGDRPRSRHRRFAGLRSTPGATPRSTSPG